VSAVRNDVKGRPDPDRNGPQAGARTATKSGPGDLAVRSGDELALATTPDEAATPSARSAPATPAGPPPGGLKDPGTRIHAWYDTGRPDGESGPGGGGAAEPTEPLERVIAAGYTGVVLYPDAGAASIAAGLPERVLRVVDVRDEAQYAAARDLIPDGVDRRRWVVSSEDVETLARAAAEGLATCLRISAHDQDSLTRAIRAGSAHRYLCMRFPDPTNIPLELVIASLQSSSTVVIKEITDPDDAEDAIVALGVMEVGSDGVLFSPRRADRLAAFAGALADVVEPRVLLSEARVVRTAPIGLGHRGCIDLATLFEPTEGLLVGSTSQGGILCCPEVFPLPYMDLRPFRVNAGAVHSYVWGRGDRTNYLSELKAGSPAMIVGLDGRTRPAPVGRIKTEIRPLRLIEVAFGTGEKANVIMQDDWHVRVYSPQGEPRNITELRPGDAVLGHIAAPGRHVGLPVDETIEEA
jgi:3-dehydroquinate synthase II/3-amino-4-hydroxybenzoic acid synthase